jgi:hypothetical protein
MLVAPAMSSYTLSLRPEKVLLISPLSVLYLPSPCSSPLPSSLLAPSPSRIRRRGRIYCIAKCMTKAMLPYRCFLIFHIGGANIGRGFILVTTLPSLEEILGHKMEQNFCQLGLQVPLQKREQNISAQVFFVENFESRELQISFNIHLFLCPFGLESNTLRV